MSHGDRKNDNTAKNRKKGSFGKIQETLRFSLETGVSSCFGQPPVQGKVHGQKAGQPADDVGNRLRQKDAVGAETKTGKSSVRGTTIRTFRSREKKIARFAQPKAVKVDCPANWKAMKRTRKSRYAGNSVRWRSWSDPR